MVRFVLLGVVVALVVAGWVWFDAPGPGAHAARERTVPESAPERSAQTQAPEPEIPLDGARALDVFVVESGTEAPIAGAEVSVRADQGTLHLPPTDAGGATRIEGLAEGMRLRLRPRAAGYPPVVLWTPHEVAGDDAVTLRVDPGRRIVWRVRADAPADGTHIGFEPFPGTRITHYIARGRIEGDRLVSLGFPGGAIKAVAVAPDATAVAVVTAARGADTGPDIEFVPPRTLTVRVVERGGGPAAGIDLRLDTHSNRKLAPVRRTGPDGVVEFARLVPQRVQVIRVDDHARYVAARADLRRGDREVELVVEPMRHVVATVLVDGRPGLPPDATVRVGRREIEEVERDAERGEMHFAFRPYARHELLPVTLRARGYGPARGEIRDGRVALALHAAGTLGVRAVRKDPAPLFGPSTVHLEKRGPGGWQRADTEGLLARGGPLFEGLRPGEYRAVHWSGDVSEPVVVSAGAHAIARIDLRAVGFVTGRIEAPPGTDPRHVGIRVGDRLVPVHEMSGRFRVSVPAGRTTRLEPHHPFHVGAAVAVRGPGEGIVLRLAPGPVARFVLEPPAAAVGVVLYRGGDEVLAAAAVRVGDAHAFGRFEPGRYRMWITARDRAPRPLPDVALGAGETDLGKVRLEDGATLRIPVLDFRHARATAEHLGEPPYLRRTSKVVNGALVLRGLGPGRFRVEYRQGPIHSVQTVDVDGDTVLETR